MNPSINKKIETVIEKNTFYFFNRSFEEKYEGHLNSLKETLLKLKNDIENKGLKNDLFERLLVEKENGLKALLTLTGFSNEMLKRLITVIEIVDDAELNKLVHKSEWNLGKNTGNSKEWSDFKINKFIKENEFFRKGIVNIFFEGATVPFLIKTIPLFELKKLSMLKLKFEIPEMIDTLVRYKEKGSYSNKKQNNPETLIENILLSQELPYESGDLPEIADKNPDTKRTMDFIIPDKKNPLIIIESSFLSTTSSGQGDKSKTEIVNSKLIKRRYRNAKFIGFVDGVGWYVRKSDLKRMVSAYEDVFTFHEEEIKRFETLLIKTFNKQS